MKYEIIYADPPWAFNNKNTGGSGSSGASAKYKVMSHADICALPVPAVSADNAVLFMWWVASQPEEALRVVRCWGFALKTMTAFVWSKRTIHGKPFFGMGFNTRQDSECCLVATRGQIKRVCASVRSTVIAPVHRHSAKPVEVRDRIIQLYGDRPRLEMFCRGSAPGWAVWGDEAENPIEIGGGDGV